MERQRSGLLMLISLFQIKTPLRLDKYKETKCTQEKTIYDLSAKININEVKVRECLLRCGVSREDKEQLISRARPTSYHVWRGQDHEKSPVKEIWRRRKQEKIRALHLKTVEIVFLVVFIVIWEPIAPFICRWRERTHGSAWWRELMDEMNSKICIFGVGKHMVPTSVH